MIRVKQAPAVGCYYYVMEMIGFDTTFHYAATKKAAQAIARELVRTPKQPCSVAIMKPIEFYRQES